MQPGMGSTSPSSPEGASESSVLLTMITAMAPAAWHRTALSENEHPPLETTAMEPRMEEALESGEALAWGGTAQQARPSTLICSRSARFGVSGFQGLNHEVYGLGFLGFRI
jgi:hypothetical protein